VGLLVEEIILPKLELGARPDALLALLEDCVSDIKALTK
jgi:hypothetical protein